MTSRLHYGIAIPFPVGEAAAQVLEPRAKARRITLNHVGQVSTRRGRACMDIVGCHLASEQPVRLYDSIAIWLWPGEVAEPIEAKGRKSL